MCSGSFCVWSILVAAAFWLAGSPSQSKPVGFANSPKGDGKPSQSAPAGRVQLPRRGSFGYLPVSTKSSPFGRAGAGAPERVQPAEGWQKLPPTAPRFRRKRRCKCRPPSTTPPVKMGYRNARRRSDIPKSKIILPLTMPRAKRRAL